MDTPHKAKQSGFKPFFWGIVLGAGVTAAIMYTNQPDPPPPDRVVDAAPAPCPEPEAKPAESTLPKKPEDFAFYDTLEQVPVPPTRPDLEQPPIPPNIAPAPVQPARTPADTAKVEPFYLQIASYKSEQDADALKARIALAGAQASIQATDIPEKGTFYRVRIGPFASREELGQAKAQLSQAGINLSQSYSVR